MKRGGETTELVILAPDDEHLTIGSSIVTTLSYKGKKYALPQSLAVAVGKRVSNINQALQHPKYDFLKVLSSSSSSLVVFSFSFSSSSSSSSSLILVLLPGRRWVSVRHYSRNVQPRSTKADNWEDSELQEVIYLPSRACKGIC
jgi:hypothetical protein